MNTSSAKNMAACDDRGDDASALNIAVVGFDLRPYV